MTFGAWLVRACAILALSLSVSSPSYALDAFWHGVRSDKWHHGPGGGASNWYSAAPPNGQTRGVPDGAAIFADNALKLTVNVVVPTTIGTIRFRTFADSYIIRVDKQLTVLTSPGVVGPTTPTVPLFDLNAQMIFQARTNPGRANYKINATGILELSLTRGIANNRVLNANKVTNSGRLILGKNRLKLATPYQQKAGSFLTVELGKDSSGILQAPNVILTGDLVVKGTPGLDPGVYQIIQANGRVGNFARVRFLGFPNTVRSIFYSNTNGNVFVRVN